MVLTNQRVIRIREARGISKSINYQECQTNDVIALESQKSPIRSLIAILLGIVFTVVGLFMLAEIPFLGLLAIPIGILLIIWGAQRSYTISCVYFSSSGPGYSSLNSIDMYGEGSDFEDFIMDFIYLLRTEQLNQNGFLRK